MILPTRSLDCGVAWLRDFMPICIAALEILSLNENKILLKIAQIKKVATLHLFTLITLENNF